MFIRHLPECDLFKGGWIRLFHAGFPRLMAAVMVMYAGLALVLFLVEPRLPAALVGVESLPADFVVGYVFFEWFKVELRSAMRKKMMYSRLLSAIRGANSNVVDAAARSALFEKAYLMYWGRKHPDLVYLEMVEGLRCLTDKEDVLIRLNRSISELRQFLPVAIAMHMWIPLALYVSVRVPILFAHSFGIYALLWTPLFMYVLAAPTAACLWSAYHTEATCRCEDPHTWVGVEKRALKIKDECARQGLI